MDIFYKSTRVGRGGRIFTLWKFRTMRAEAGPDSTAEDDPRITKTGKILRKTHLDELPQIINILKGELGFIGWRPEVPKYLNTIPQIVLKTKPGIIGLATLWDINEGIALKGSQDPDKDYEEKIMPRKRKLEVYYSIYRSPSLDAHIFFRTFTKLLGFGWPKIKIKINEERYEL